MFEELGNITLKPGQTTVNIVDVLSEQMARAAAKMEEDFYRTVYETEQEVAPVKVSWIRQLKSQISYSLSMWKYRFITAWEVLKGEHYCDY